MFKHCSNAFAIKTNALKIPFLISFSVALVACGGNQGTPSSEPPASSSVATQSSSSVVSVSSVESSSVSSVASSSASSITRPSGPPVNSGSPNASNQTPAFPEQTRAPEVVTNISLQVEPIATNLGIPWGLDFMPDGRMIVTIRNGDLLVVTPNGTVSQVSGVPSVYTSFQGGLLDVLLAEDFESSRMVYLSYSENRGNGQNATAVARGRLSNDDSRLENVEVIFRQEPAWDSALHFGSRLVWDDQGHLYITLGERSLPQPRQLSQDVNSTLGKVVRVHPDGAAPSDNPFVNGNGLDEVWSYGHRNVQGAAINPYTGDLWTVEHGPRGGDEINIPKAGLNYGWPIITYGIDYNGSPIGNGITAMAGMEQPTYYWDPVIAPSDMTFYTGTEFPEWQGNLFIASLNPGGVVRLMLDGDVVIGEERLLSQLGRVRDIAQGPDGALYATSDSGSYSLVKITRQ